MKSLYAHKNLTPTAHIDGYLTASVPEDSFAPLEIDFYVRDGQPTTLQADLAGIGVVVASQ